MKCPKCGQTVKRMLVRRVQSNDVCERDFRWPTERYRFSIKRFDEWVSSGDWLDVGDLQETITFKCPCGCLLYRY